MSEFEGDLLTPHLVKIEGLKRKKVLDVGAGPHEPIVDVIGNLYGPETGRNNVVSVDKGFDDWQNRMHLAPNSAAAKAEQLPFKDKSFEVVTMINVLHVLEWNSVIEPSLSEAARVLKPGGTLLVLYAALKPRIDASSRLGMLFKVLINDRKLDRHMAKYRQDIEKAGFEIKEDSNDYRWGAIQANFIASKK